MTDDKKKDKVISLEDFNRSVRKAEGDEPESPTIEMIAEAMQKHNLEDFIGVGVTQDGRIAFYTTTSDYGQILFLCETYKKLIMEGVAF